MKEMSKESQIRSNGGYYVGYCVKSGCGYTYQGYNLNTVKAKMIEHCNNNGGYLSGHRYRVEEY